MPDDLTPIEQSRADNGRRYFAIKTGFYNGFSTSLNAKRNRPTGVGTKAVTLREVPVAADVPLSIDGQFRLLSYPHHLWTEGDEDVFNVEHPNFLEVTREEWEALFPDPEG